jgi:hypothetical protein
LPILYGAEGLFLAQKGPQSDSYSLCSHPAACFEVKAPKRDRQNFNQKRCFLGMRPGRVVHDSNIRGPIQNDSHWTPTFRAITTQADNGYRNWQTGDFSTIHIVKLKPPLHPTTTSNSRASLPSSQPELHIPACLDRLAHCAPIFTTTIS